MADPDPALVVVVADDDPLILQLVVRRLRHRGYELHTATNGEEALEAIRTHLPDAAVLDWVMPVKQGDQVLQEMRADAATADIPVILLTARANETDVLAGFDAGADEYLTKPFDIEELDETLRRLVAAAG